MPTPVGDSDLNLAAEVFAAELGEADQQRQLRAARFKLLPMVRDIRCLVPPTSGYWAATKSQKHFARGRRSTRELTTTTFP